MGGVCSNNCISLPDADDVTLKAHVLKYPTAMLICLQKRQFPTALRLIEFDPACCDVVDNKGDTPLIYACTRLQAIDVYNYADVAKVIIKSGRGRINHVNPRTNESALFACAREEDQSTSGRSLPVLTALLQDPLCNVNTVDAISGKTLLSLCMQSKNPKLHQMIPLFLPKVNFEVTDKNGRNFIFWSAQTDPKVLNMMHESGKDKKVDWSNANIRHIDNNGDTMLSFMIKHRILIKPDPELLKLGQLDYIDRNGNTLLMLALNYDSQNTKFIHAVLDRPHVCNPGHVNKQGQTALMITVLAGRLDVNIVKRLVTELKTVSNPRHKDKYGRTALHLVIGHYAGAADVMIDSGVFDPFERDVDGVSPLQKAVNLRLYDLAIRMTPNSNTNSNSRMVVLAAKQQHDADDAAEIERQRRWREEEEERQRRAFSDTSS